jgi:hypothetical protein
MVSIADVVTVPALLVAVHVYWPLCSALVWISCKIQLKSALMSKHDFLEISGLNESTQEEFSR